MCKEIRQKMAQEYKESLEKERQKKCELLKKWEKGEINSEEAQELLNFLEKDIEKFETQKNWEGVVVTTLLKVSLKWYIEFKFQKQTDY